MLYKMQIEIPARGMSNLLSFCYTVESRIQETTFLDLPYCVRRIPYCFVYCFSEIECLSFL